MFLDWFESQSPVIMALMATGFTWFVTAMGSAVVFFFKTTNKTMMDAMLGFASGVMMTLDVALG